MGDGGLTTGSEIAYGWTGRPTLFAWYAADQELDLLSFSGRVPDVPGMLEGTTTVSLLVERTVSEDRYASASAAVNPARVSETHYTGRILPQRDDETTPFRSAALLARAEETGQFLPIVSLGGHMALIVGPGVQNGRRPPPRRSPLVADGR